VVSAFTVNLISGLARNDAAKLDNPDYNITPQLWTDYWKSDKEHTLSAKDILHFEVFKAGARPPIIAEFDARMTNVAMQSGCSPKRWKMVIDEMLIKKEGVTLVETLRMIILFMVDYNYIHKHIRRTMMSNAERYGQLGPEQYGSRNGHTEIMQASHKKITLGIAHQK
jgi:hypothetical protein